MTMTTSPVRSDRVAALPPYLFVDIDRKRRARIAAGADVINLGIGDPDRPTPDFIIEALRAAAGDPVNHRYADGRGSGPFRQAAARFLKKRFGVTADPDRHITAIIGSKEAVFHLPLGVLNPGDGVLVPSPGYPVYESGAIFACAEVIDMPLLPELGWRPDLDAISPADRARARLMWANYPNNPTAACVDVDFFTTALRFSDANDIVLASDQAYSEIYFDAPPPSVWQADGADLDSSPVIELHSLSKTFNMTGWRIGFAVGRPDLIDALSAVKSNADSGPFGAVQDAAIAALDGYDRPEVAHMREVYRQRRDALIPALRDIGCQVEPPAAGFFVWARCPAGPGGAPLKSMDFAARCLEEADVVVVPSVGFSKRAEGWFRIALTVEVDRITEAADRLRRLWGR
ncbi:MAG: aminotransferase class I/II-fold pyridoxal phosphate-dependent enzyme [Phycisphaerales bacterium JB039]